MECLLPALLTFGVRTGRLSIEQVAAICSENPARRFGLYPRKGVLQAGSDADFVIVDLDKRALVDDDYYEGWIRDWKRLPRLGVLRHARDDRRARRDRRASRRDRRAGRLRALRWRRSDERICVVVLGATRNHKRGTS